MPCHCALRLCCVRHHGSTDLRIPVPNRSVFPLNAFISCLSMLVSLNCSGTIYHYCSILNSDWCPHRIISNQGNVGLAMPFAPSPIHHHFYGWYKHSNHQKIGWFMELLYPHDFSRYFHCSSTPRWHLHRHEVYLAAAHVAPQRTRG